MDKPQFHFLPECLTQGSLYSMLFRTFSRVSYQRLETYCCLLLPLRRLCLGALPSAPEAPPHSNPSTSDPEPLPPQRSQSGGSPTTFRVSDQRRRGWRVGEGQEGATSSSTYQLEPGSPWVSLGKGGDLGTGPTLPPPPPSL